MMNQLIRSIMIERAYLARLFQLCNYFAEDDVSISVKKRNLVFGGMNPKSSFEFAITLNKSLSEFFGVNSEEFVDINFTVSKEDFSKLSSHIHIENKLNDLKNVNVNGILVSSSTQKKTINASKASSRSSLVRFINTYVVSLISYIFKYKSICAKYKLSLKPSDYGDVRDVVADTDQQSIDITPEMKESVLKKGQALFQPTQDCILLRELS